MNTTIRNRLISAATILLSAFVMGVFVWALTERAPAAWLWWALLSCTCILGLFTLLFAASPDGIPFVIYGESFRPTSRK